MKVGIFSHFNNSYSGGRIHAWFIAEGLAAKGHLVTVFTNQKPGFLNDFICYPAHNKIGFKISKNFNINSINNDFDVIYVIPDMGGNFQYYFNIIRFVEKGTAKLILINFETVNWKSSINRYQNDSTLDNGSWELSLCADMILSSSYESEKFARIYFKEVKQNCQFVVCYPPIHTIHADKVDTIKKEKRIVIITRFSPRYKNGHRLMELMIPEMEDHEIVLIIGFGGIDKLTEKRYRQAVAKVGAKLTIKTGISELEKFRLLKNSILSIFPSMFEGFGLPPVESIYCKTPCICFRLPVLLEVNANSLLYAKVNDFVDFKKKIKNALLNSGETFKKIENVNYFGYFSDFSNCIEQHLDSLFAEVQ